MQTQSSLPSPPGAPFGIGGLELHQSVAIVELQSQQMQHIEAQQTGNLKAGIVIDRGGIELENMVLVLEGEIRKLEIEFVAIDVRRRTGRGLQRYS